jgi:hypothetical protein
MFQGGDFENGVFSLFGFYFLNPQETNLKTSDTLETFSLDSNFCHVN